MEFRPWADVISRWAGARRRDVVLMRSVHSTNRLGLEILSRGSHRGADDREAGAWVFALHQWQGSGRFGRPWSSPLGAGVYASLLLHVARDVLPTLPLVVGVGLCQGLSAIGFDCRLKWPNDIQLNGRKVGGILVQSRISRQHAKVVVGFGVNHSHRAADLPRPDATSLELAASASPPTLAALTTSLADAVESELDRHRRSGSWDSASLVSRYGAWSAHRPGDRLEAVVGGELHSGEFMGFSDQGHLRLQTQSGEKLVAAGEIGSE